MAYVVSAHWRAKEGKEGRLAELIEELEIGRAHV